jgi:RNA polymerase sigma-70 factor (ECF subfamily)
LKPCTVVTAGAFSRRCALDRLKHERRTYTDSEGLLAALEAPATELQDVAAGASPDDRLSLIFTCCHPALAQSAQVALALRALCGLTTRKIARAFVEPETATAQKLVRAKRKIASGGDELLCPDLCNETIRLGRILGELESRTHREESARDRSLLIARNVMEAVYVAATFAGTPSCAGVVGAESIQ